MILSELTNYLAEHKRVALIDLVHRFDTDADVLRGMLAMLERKGRVRKLPAGTACAARRVDPLMRTCRRGPQPPVRWKDRPSRGIASNPCLTHPTAPPGRNSTARHPDRVLSALPVTIRQRPARARRAPSGRSSAAGLVDEVGDVCGGAVAAVG